ncbi:30S ribosomal protein S20 [Candidatus Nitrosacidococcus sp. I8]|uniref:30S ribosomal protein S20 n=1 Tax=Candidatus Nitrosacidococcus sp. I8 TaxID=2942908 RepID=UPI0022273A73|nr:30S ribosomal protein S20 [Candidatus Nitrosacidococcus sp. I8]CAH9019837.1 30S ribosomal protein S20 [Candidatus Nitrosacidococcus sp. I8]
MANTAQARKRARQAEKHRKQNSSQRSEMRTYIKKTLKAIVTGNREQAIAAYKIMVPTLDRLARKGLIHINKAARYKSRINTKIHLMA